MKKYIISFIIVFIVIGLFTLWYFIDENNLVDEVADTGQSELSMMCQAESGTWLEEFEECEYISEQSCIQMGGKFFECESACRNNPDAEICTLQCVQVCKFNISGDNEKATYDDLIIVNSPDLSEELTSPLVITGEARGFWFFEASFPVRLLDDNNQEIAIGIATAQGDWMTEDFVPFEVTLEFSTTANTGTLILQKDNPSGLPEHDDALEIPVSFE